MSCSSYDSRKCFLRSAAAPFSLPVMEGTPSVVKACNLTVTSQELDRGAVSALLYYALPLGVHLGFSRSTLLCDRMSLFKLNSVSGRNNRLKCLEFFNPVDGNYVKQDN